MTELDDAELAHNREAAAFVQSLAKALSASPVHVPSCPEAALRLQRALSSTDIDPSVVESAASADPALALRIMRMANSVMLNPLGREVRDLRTAISRIGYNMVRTAAVSFMVAQLLDADATPGQREQLVRLWEESLHVAAFATLLTRRHTRLNPDVALLVGLLQGVGKLYILTRLATETSLRDIEPVRERILRDWHPSAARVIVQSWSLSDEIAVAVQACHDVETVRTGPATLGEVVAASRLLVSADLRASGGSSEAVVEGNMALFTRLGIDVAAADLLVQDAYAQLDSLHAAIGV